jgi:hypothetical protein
MSETSAGKPQPEAILLNYQVGHENVSFFCPIFSGAHKSESFCFQSERLLYGREPNAVRDGTGKAEGAKLQDAGISLKQCPEKMKRQKRLAYGTRKIGVLPAETSGQVKRKRKSQLCDDHHTFENGARFEGLLPFAAVTSEWPTSRQLTKTSSTNTIQPQFAS